MLELWKHFLDEESMNRLGLSVAEVHAADTTTVNMTSAPNHFIVPHDALQSTLQVACERRILDMLKGLYGSPIHVQLRWRSKMLWEGDLRPLTSIELLLNLLDIVFEPFLGQQAVRLICFGRVVYKVTIAELMRPSFSDILTLNLQFRTSGGAGSKENHRVHVKNAIAASLLEHGFPMHWPADSVDHLMKEVGVKALTQVVAMPSGQRKLDQTLQLCKDSAIAVPAKLTKDATKVV